MTDLAPYPDTFELDAGGFAMLSPAKVNLRLRVLGRRRDGYHELNTLFQEISLVDRLEFYPGHEWILEIHGAALDSGERNLITRAARLLARESKVPCRGRVVLYKQIPSGGGLGGGSSNAAIALIGLSRLWNLNWDVHRLHPFAAQIGSDCPFFLYGGLAEGYGRGEVLELLEDRFDRDLLMVMPPFGISTAEVYSWSEFPLTHNEKSVNLGFWVKTAERPRPRSELFVNDLESLVLSRYDSLALIKNQLLEAGAEHALLSGSGSCIFAAFSDHLRMLQAAQHVREPYHAVIIQTVSRPRYR